jgi:protein-disulfide isomerase
MGEVIGSWLADGAWIWGAFLVVAFFVLVFAYFTETGSGIRYRAWTNAEGGAPGALGMGNAAGKDPAADVRMWTRGTSARRRRRNVPVARTAAELERRADDELLSKLATWRARMNAAGTGLSEPVDPDRDHVLGRPDAPVTLVEYTDFECPSCQAAAAVVARLRRDLGDDLCFALRHFPIADAHLNALEAAEAVEAAGAQGRLWDMHDAIYRSRRPPDADGLRRIARKLRLDMDRFERELAGHVHAERVRRDFESGLLSGVNGTPTFYVNGARYDGDTEYDELRAAIDRARDEAAAVAA